MNITGATRPFALLGDPVAHSFSPAMQNAAILAAGIDAVYFALRCGEESVPALIHTLARSGGGGNVTIPHKAVAAAAIERPSASVIATGACNTFWLEDGHVRGDNTDVEGFEAAAKSIIGTLQGVHACVLGTGGAARAVVHAILRSGGEALVLGRSPAALEAIEAAFANDPRLRTAAGANPLPPRSLNLLVNATPVGMSGDGAPPIDLDALPGLRAVIDLVTRTGGTPLTRAAAVRGIAAIDGREMLLAQGAAAFERWFRRPAPVDAMRAAIAD
jgi:shikimate dehydrogenase